MSRLGLETEIHDPETYRRTVERFATSGIALPTFAQIADPTLVPEGITNALGSIGPDDPHPLNLFRVHWYNDLDRRSRTDLPAYLSLPSALTGVPSPILVALGATFPMIGAHKVLAAYGCLAPGLVTGRFDPTQHRAIWPSTGNYCRGGVAISRIMGCRGIAVLPEGMSAERFEWLERWVSDPTDIVRTPGTESNVKEIYDRCAELEQDPENIIFNQFCEYGNHLVHRRATGRAMQAIFEAERERRPGLQLTAFVSATGSAGTIAAGEDLREEHGTRIVAVEAVECPTLLYNGYGEHNIQGIGDKHLPLIHNVLSTDLVVGISDRTSDSLGLLFNSEVGRRYLTGRRGLDPALVASLEAMGLSGIANVAAAIKTARALDLGPDDAIVTVATDSAALYETERTKTHEDLGREFDEVVAGEIHGQHLAGLATDHVLELTHRDRDRIFNLGYFTWVEQQGVSLEEFEARRRRSHWTGLLDHIAAWDERIEAFNAETGVLEKY